jgi:signal transduction histidine kinase
MKAATFFSWIAPALVACLFIADPSASAQADSLTRHRLRDSLESVLAKEKDYKKEVRLLYNIIDLSADDGQTYQNKYFADAIRRMYDLSVRNGDMSLQLDMLIYLGRAYIDSLDHYMQVARKLPVSNQQKAALAYMQYTNTANVLNYASDTLVRAMLVRLLSDYQNADDGDLYKRLGLLSSVCVVMNHVTTGQMYIEYLHQFEKLVDDLPKDGRSFFPNALYVIIANAYSNNGTQQESLNAERKLQAFLRDLEARRKDEGRSYNSMVRYMYLSSSRMLKCPDVLSRKEIDSVYRSIIAMTKASPELAADLKESGLSHIRYYMSTKQYSKAIPYLDVDLDHGRTWYWEECLKDRIIAGNELKEDGPDFVKYSRMYIAYVNDRKEKDIAEKATELQIVYDVNNLEKHISDLNAEKNRQKAHLTSIMMVIALIAILILVAMLVNAARSRKILTEKNKELDQARLKAVFANRMKNMFIENINHEIRTPLNAIVGFSDIVAGGEENVSDEERKSYSNIIRSNSEVLLSTISDLLDISDMESGRIVLKKSPCSLNDICESAVAFYKSRVPDKVLMVFNPHSEDVVVTSDARRLSQVLRHYLSNAIKNTKRGSIVVDYAQDNETGKVALSVTDTGCGVPVDKAEEIFNHFEKLDTFKEGAGIGLSICKMIADALNAEAKVDTGYKGGARFLFILPGLQ